MISTYFHGEMGNNIAQFAATLAHAERMGIGTEFSHQRDCRIPVSQRPLELPDMFDYTFNFVDTYSQQYIIYQHKDLSLNVADTDFDFSYTPIAEKDGVMLRGYFQSEKYFENIKDKIKDIYFKPSKDVVKSLNEKWMEKYDFSNAIAIHVRIGGDRPGIKEWFPTCPSSYYIDATNIILERDSDVDSIFCFSDDIEWCKNNMASDDLIFIEGNNAVEDMFLMSYCKHDIIGNSSFSWWAAYLNNNPDKIVVVPDSWWFGQKLSHLNRKDLFLNEWIKL